LEKARLNLEISKHKPPPEEYDDEDEEGDVKRQR
jgi:hypothetical protein